MRRYGTGVGSWGLDEVGREARSRGFMGHV